MPTSLVKSEAMEILLQIRWQYIEAKATFVSREILGAKRLRHQCQLSRKVESGSEAESEQP